MYVIYSTNHRLLRATHSHTMLGNDIHVFLFDRAKRIFVLRPNHTILCLKRTSYPTFFFYLSLSLFLSLLPLYSIDCARIPRMVFVEVVVCRVLMTPPCLAMPKHKDSKLSQRCDSFSFFCLCKSVFHPLDRYSVS